MRHRVFGKKLSRTHKMRQRLFRSLVSNFILNDKLTTSVTKVKAIVPLVEHLLTKAKKNDAVTKKYLYSKLINRPVVEKILNIAKNFKDTPGGYTKTVKIGIQRGDASKTVRLLWSREFEIKEPIIPSKKDIIKPEEIVEVKKDLKAKKAKSTNKKVK